MSDIWTPDHGLWTPKVYKAGDIIWTAEEVEAAIDTGSHEVHERYKNIGNLLILTVLRGAADYSLGMDSALARHYPDFRPPHAEITTSTYSADLGVRIPVIKRDVPQELVEGMFVVIREDIVDSGVTFELLIPHLETKGIDGYEINSLVNRVNPDRAIQPDIAHLQLDSDAFIIGYGLNDDGLSADPFWGKKHADGGRSLRDIRVSPIR